MTLAEFCAARLDEKEASAWAVHDVAKCDAMLYEEDMADYAARNPDCDCGYPARIQREVEAGRKILAAYQAADAARKPFDPPDYAAGIRDGLSDGLLAAVGHMAAADNGHADYQAWTMS